MTALSNKFRYQLEHTSDFIISFELIPGYSGRGRSLQKVLDFAKSAAEDEILDTLTLTDNPGGNPSLSPDELGKRIADIGIAPVIHITCRDSNRFGMFSRIQQLDRMGIQNLLVLTGDYPAELPSGTAKPCFDLDSVSLLCLLTKMNLGLQPFCMRAKGPISGKTDFFPGAAVSCYKFSEAEQFTQYFKLLKKVRNGAQFVITQLCYDARKFHELLLFLKSVQVDVPVIGTVYMLTEPVARFMNAGKVPGAFVTNKLYQLVADEAKTRDKGKSALLERTARLLAVLKGLGYRGAHIGGSPIYKDVKEVIRHFEDIQDDWRSFLPEFDFPYKNGFYLYRPNPETRLNSTAPSQRSSLAVTKAIVTTFFDVFHEAVFNKETPYYSLLKRCAQLVSQHRTLKIPYVALEDLSKRLLFDCHKCGDCALFEMAYLCPESQCPKYLRNGPCGGSEKTRCEVFKDRPCVWVRVYDRLKSVGRQEELKGRCVPARNWALNETSSWLNFFLGLDHHETSKNDCYLP